MTTTFDFIVSFNEFVSNVDELINEAYNNSQVSEDFIDAIDDDFDTIYNDIVNDIESNQFDQISHRNILTDYFKSVEIIRNRIKSNKFYNEYVFLNSLIDCWNEFVIEIGPRD